MHRLAIGFVTSALLVLGQTSSQSSVEKILYFAHTEDSRTMQEVAQAIRATLDMPQVTFAGAPQAVTARGTADQVAAAEWIFSELDRAPSVPRQHSTSHQYVIPGEREGVVRIFTTANTANIQEFQEIAQLLRTVVDIRRIFTNNALSAIVLRADAAQIGLAEPLFDALDQPADAPKQHRVSSEFLLAGDKEGVTRVFFVANAATIQAFQEMAQLIRTAVEVRRTFTLNAPKAIIVRGTADQVAMAEWLLNEADQASTVMPDQAVREYRTPGAGDLAVRVFYVPGAASIQDFQRIAQQVRGAQGILKVSQYNDRRLLTVKGTTAQIAAAERVIKESTLLSKQ